MSSAKKLIEVAMPVKEVSAASVHDKYIHHGHISTLHLWWARRPLPMCRAVVFASLVPDPLDPACPPAFVEAVKVLLGPEGPMLGDPYKPYDDVPWTSVYDPVEDNPRNRLQAFIGRFSSAMEDHLIRGKKAPAPAQQLSEASLTKWDNKNNETILGIARKLIWVAHNAGSKTQTAKSLLADFDTHYAAIKTAEDALYGLLDRHLESAAVKKATANLEQAIEVFLDKMPRVFDPFAGGGAIPLEAARLGCRSFGNDINPVAHIIQKGSLEFPQRFGKPITYSKAAFIQRYGQKAWDAAPGADKTIVKGEATAVRITNRLAHDVEFFARRILQLAEKKLDQIYPKSKDGQKPLAYYWVRVGNCSNPTCKAEIPLLKNYYLSNKSKKQIYLQPIIKGKKIKFEIRYGTFDGEPWVLKSALKCPICGNLTGAKEIQLQYKNGGLQERLIAVIEDSSTGKTYRVPTEQELQLVHNNRDLIKDIDVPTEHLPVELTGGSIMSWGATRWSQMFSARQMFAMHTLIECLNIIKEEMRQDSKVSEDYKIAVITYLGIWMDRIASYLTSFGRWIPQNEQLASVFGRQAIAMVFDYPEVSVLSPTTSGALNQLEWIKLYIESESPNPFWTVLRNASSGEREQFPEKYLTAVITDPPYYDAIAYADLSDFFYVWMKRTLGDLYPDNFAYPQTPKSEECTALKHHRNGSKYAAMRHFKDKLSQILDAIESQTSELVSIMFAHQSTEAWTTLCNSILGARMNITGSWAIDSERDTRMVALGTAALQSSVTVACRPAQRNGVGDFREVRFAIENRIREEVRSLYALGFRGADLLTACFGQAVSEFGQYKSVEKADGSEVTIGELLSMARDAAFNALVTDFPGDQFTKFYIGWLQLYGFTESEHDDVARLSQVGLSIAVNDIVKNNLLIKQSNKETLATFQQRIEMNRKLGTAADSLLIDKVHRAMALLEGARPKLLEYIADTAAEGEAPFWRALTGIAELTKGTKDGEVASTLLANKDSLIRESLQNRAEVPTQSTMFE